MILIEAVLLIFLLVAAMAICVKKRLLTSVIILAAFSVVMSVLWILLTAPDLAITEAAAATGVSSILFFVVLTRIKAFEEEHKHKIRFHKKTDYSIYVNSRFLKWLYRGKRLRYFFNTISVIFCLCFVCILLFTVSHLPSFGNPDNPSNNEVPQKYIEEGISDTGAVNIVAGMILDYRAFDTFGEACVLFSAVSAILMLMQRSGRSDLFDILLQEMEEPWENIILKNIAFLLVPMIMIFGFYIILNGHRSPGGGFSGGAILGASLILYTSAYGKERAGRFLSYKFCSRTLSVSLGFYALAKGYSFFMGANNLVSGIPKGTPGDLFSAGLIMPLNISIGLIVACTVYMIYILFSRGELK